jgi:hypothetical protein
MVSLRLIWLLFGAMMLTEGLILHDEPLSKAALLVVAIQVVVDAWNETILK